MKKLLIALAAVLITAATYGQGQVVFSNRVLASGVDAPVTIAGSNPLIGPGPGYSAQLYVKNADGTTVALSPASTFNAAGTGAAAIADRYWKAQTIDVAAAPGANATFFVRAWQTALGTYDQAANARGQSPDFTIAVGGGTLPPANLTTLQAFAVTVVPEPTVIALGVLGASALLLRRRK